MLRKRVARGAEIVEAAYVRADLARTVECLELMRVHADKLRALADWIAAGREG